MEQQQIMDDIRMLPSTISYNDNRVSKILFF